MIDPTSLRRRHAPIDRSTDRLVALGAIAGALAFLVFALLAAVLPPAARLGIWLPLHLALAGAAGTAIAGVMPFFSAAFAAAPPVDARLRSAAVVAISGGAAAVSGGFAATQAGIAVLGGVVFVVGIALTGIATVRPLAGALGPSRGLIVQGYVVALVEVVVGASISTLYLAGWSPLVQHWGTVKPAHAWLNLVGFESLVIATTLLHFFPTVVGARIKARRSARATVVGLAAGAPLVAVGVALGSDLVARVGAIAVVVGALALATYALATWPTRGRWTTDLDWHRFAMGGLVAAIAWFVVGIVIAAWRLLAFGADPAGWAPDAILGPLVVGWVGLTLVASATHLIPAVGPGDQAAHARQRVILGRAATVRLIAANAGALGLLIGLPLHQGFVSSVGLVLSAIGLGGTALLIGTAVWIGLRPGSPAAPG